ncbi:MAG TPA: LLM class flavin-dependent oxidoreductase [Hyphomicrobiales bacterium]|nr:LLM class flavin-dependent oxidoreductase [Hyphomicrobiales bacterium]
MTALSVLDLAPVTTATSGAEALKNTIDLARHVDRLGYIRYWLAEHHNIASIASSAPDIMIGQVAAATSHIRVGSGGVMLANHSPLQLVERFKTLEALFPDRIDLGLGRAPGTDPLTSYALRRPVEDIPPDQDFLQRLQEVMLFGNGGFPADHPFRHIKVSPSGTPMPPLWLLGSSDYSALLSAQIGVGFAFAHHFATHDAAEAVQSYRSNFRPSPALAAPYAILGVSVVCADTEAEAERLARTGDLSFLRIVKNERAPLASPEEAAAYPYTEAERERIRAHRSKMFVGTPDIVREGLLALVQATGADELMAVTSLYDHAARKRSYTLLAETFGLAQVP